MKDILKIAIKKATLTSRFFYCSETQIIELVDQVELLQYGYQ